MALVGDQNLAASGIVVTGEGVVRAAPDLATVMVGVQTRSTTAKDAQEQNNATMSSVLTAIKALGIADKDIQTSGLSLSPAHDNNGQVNGYHAVNTVTVVVQDIGAAGSVLDAAVAAGANTAGSVRFGFKDDSALEQQALDAAAKDARAKADAIAKAMGVQITGIQAAVEEFSGGPGPVYETARLAADMASSVPIQTGELAITARLRVTYTY